MTPQPRTARTQLRLRVLLLLVNGSKAANHSPPLSQGDQQRVLVHERHSALHRARVLVMVLTEVDVCGV